MRERHGNLPLVPRRSVLSWVSAAFAIVFLVAPSVLAAGAKKAPQAGGSLQLSERDCDDSRDPSAVFTFCEYDYFVDPARESDLDDYTVQWHQTAIDPRPGWCVTEAHGGIREYGSHVVAWAPHPRSTAGRTDLRLMLRSADGHRLGTVKQRFLLRDGTTKAEVRRDRRLQWRWQGFSRHTILIVTGVAFAHPPPDDPPELVISGTSTFTAKTVAC